MKIYVLFHKGEGEASLYFGDLIDVWHFAFKEDDVDRSHRPEIYTSIQAFIEIGHKESPSGLFYLDRNQAICSFGIWPEKH